MLNVFSSKLESFGLDFSDFSLKFAKLAQRGNDYELVSCGEVEVPRGIMEKSEIKDEKKLSQIIRQGLESVQGKKIKDRYVISSLPEEKSFLDVLKIPQLEEKEVRPALMVEAESHIPLPIKEVYCDFEKIENINKNATYQEMLFVAVPKTIVDSYVRVLKMAGLQPKAMEVESLAVARTLIREDGISKPFLVIDFGQTRISFVIVAGQHPRFTSSILMSSAGLTQHIAKNLNVDFAKAEDLKIKEGLTGKKEVFEAAIPILTDLAEQIKNHLNYYRSHSLKLDIIPDGQEIGKVILCGGGSNLKGLTEFLSSELNTVVELGNPWTNITKPKNRVIKLKPEDALRFTTAFGLALRDMYGD